MQMVNGLINLNWRIRNPYLRPSASCKGEEEYETNNPNHIPRLLAMKAAGDWCPMRPHFGLKHVWDKCEFLTLTIAQIKYFMCVTSLIKIFLIESAKSVNFQWHFATAISLSTRISGSMRTWLLVCLVLACLLLPAEVIDIIGLEAADYLLRGKMCQCHNC